MNRVRALVGGFVLITAAATGCNGYAQGIPVFDGAAVASMAIQLTNDTTKIKHLYDQLTNMRDQLKAMTGGRGMENVMRNEMVRDYLPSDWKSVGDLLNNTAGQYGQIAQSAQSTANANAVLKPEDLARLSPELRALAVRARNSAATQQALASSSYNNASANVQRLQVLMDQIKSANDMKAISDLQARINAEQLMLQNDAIKLNQASQSLRGDVDSLNRQIGEQVAALSGTSVDNPRVRITPRSKQ